MLRISYSPQGVDFFIEDDFCHEVEQKLSGMLGIGESCTVGVNVDLEGAVSHSFSSFDNKLEFVSGTHTHTEVITAVEMYFSKNLQRNRYIPSSQNFLLSYNKVTGSSDMSVMSEVEAQKVISRSLREPSKYSYSSRSVEYLIERGTGKCLFEDHEYYPGKVTSDEVIVIDRLYGARAKIRDGVAGEYGTERCLVVNASSLGRVPWWVMRVLVNELIRDRKDRAKVSEVRLVGFSARQNKYAAHALRYRGEGFVIW